MKNWRYDKWQQGRTIWGKYDKDGTPYSIDEYKSAFSCTFLVTKNGKITAAEGVHDYFF